MKIMNTVAVLLAFSVSGVYAACPANLALTTPDSRFTENGNGTVADSVTGLMWKQCSEGVSTTSTACDKGALLTTDWQTALGAAVTANGGGGFAGYTDWRLPNIKELATIVELGCHSPTINEMYFPQTASAGYWSASTSAVDDTRAWGVVFLHGVNMQILKNSVGTIRLVRDSL